MGLSTECWVGSMVMMMKKMMMMMIMDINFNILEERKWDFGIQ
jgi:hypothetical protein